MNFSLAHHLSRYIITVVASVGLALTAVTAACAFTFEGQSEGNSDHHGFTDLQLPGASKSDTHSSLSESGDHTVKSGNTTFQFGTQPSFDQRYNPNNLFDPFAREGR